MQHLFNNKVSVQRGYKVPDGMGGFTTTWADLERLNISNIVGVFEDHETITGGTSEATAKVGKVGSDYLEIYERSSTDFQIGETVTGGISEATAKIDSIKSLASVPCRLQPYLGLGREIFIGGKDTVFASHRLFMAVPFLTITEEDRSKLGERIFDVKLIKNWNEAGEYYRLELLEVT